ncbi:MAG: DUF2279 domain-containing protein [Ignavibacteriae bacterium]|nr:DUF2279 domain-containing protein [Ignavibacteriota bacterium]
MKKTLVILLIMSASLSHAQDSLRVTDGFSVKPEFTGRKIVATSAIGGLFALSAYWCYDSWWRNAGGGLHFKTDNWLNGYASGIDKVGHFYTSYFYYHLFRNIMLWGGYEQSTAEWWALGGATGFAVIVEMGDGLTPSYGFDYQDLIFNLGGVGYGFLQSRVPFLKNFNFKWSYVPSDGYRFPIRLVEHYDDHTYWLTCNVNNLLPDAIEPYWPDWLQLAVGMGVDDHWTKREFVFGFDLNLESLFHTENEDVLLFEKTVNMFHIPAPAIKFTEGKRTQYYLFHRN